MLSDLKNNQISSSTSRASLAYFMLDLLVNVRSELYTFALLQIKSLPGLHSWTNSIVGAVFRPWPGRNARLLPSPGRSTVELDDFAGHNSGFSLKSDAGL